MPRNRVVCDEFDISLSSDFLEEFSEMDIARARQMVVDPFADSSDGHAGAYRIPTPRIPTPRLPIQPISRRMPTISMPSMYEDGESEREPEQESRPWYSYVSSQHWADPPIPNNGHSCDLCHEGIVTANDDGTCTGGIMVAGTHYETNHGIIEARGDCVLYVCDECSTNNRSPNGPLVRCDMCGRDLMSYASINVDSRRYCPKCAQEAGLFVCEHCGDIHTASERIDIADRHYCRECDDRCDFRCDSCGRLLERDELHPLNGHDLCHQCADHAMQSMNNINDCYYRPSRFRMLDVPGQSTLAASPLYMGVECEIDYKDLSILNHDDSRCKAFTVKTKLSNILHEMGQPIYFKNDGSLKCGFEIVSHPASLEYHTNVMQWKEIFKTAVMNGFQSDRTDTCGLHVHVDRKFLGKNSTVRDLNTAKLILLVSKFWDSHVINFSRRNISALDNYAKKPMIICEPGDDDVSVLGKLRGQHTGNHHDRYYAVNVQNEHTVEFRMFKGTLNHKTFLACLQWVQTLCEYVKTLDVKRIYGTTWGDIFGNTPYPELMAYMKKRNLI